MNIFPMTQPSMPKDKSGGKEKKTDLLKHQPQIGKVVEEMNQPEIRELVEGNYRIVYRIVTAQRIDILMVHHGARDLNQRFNQ